MQGGGVQLLLMPCRCHSGTFPVGPSAHGLNELGDCLFHNKLFPWVQAEDSEERGRNSAVTAGTEPGKGEREPSRAIDVTSSTSPVRPQKTFLMYYPTNSFWDLLFSNCLTIFPAPLNPWVLLCGNGESRQHISPWFTQPSLLLTK